VLAGDGIRCDFLVALMERAATTGLLAANQLLHIYVSRAMIFGLFRCAHVTGSCLWCIASCPQIDSSNSRCAPRGEPLPSPRIGELGSRRRLRLEDAQALSAP
jgi:hypothetical protein